MFLPNIWEENSLRIDRVGSSIALFRTEEHYNMPLVNLVIAHQPSNLASLGAS